MCVSECVLLHKRKKFKKEKRKKEKKKEKRKSEKIEIQGKFATLDYYPLNTRRLDISIPLRFAVNSFFGLFIYFTVRVLFEASDLITAIVWLLVLLIKAGDPLDYPTDYNGQSLVDLH